MPVKKTTKLGVSKKSIKRLSILRTVLKYNFPSVYFTYFLFVFHIICPILTHTWHLFSTTLLHLVPYLLHSCFFLLVHTKTPGLPMFFTQVASCALHLIHHTLPTYFLVS